MNLSSQYAGPYGHGDGASAFGQHLPHHDNTTASGFMPAAQGFVVDNTTTVPVTPSPNPGQAFSSASPSPGDDTTSSSGGSFACVACPKTYARQCDLNRHKLTHERPKKCQIKTCEFFTRGFPTSQERDRHMRDRHSDAPPLFHCHFQPCNYTSKRESNCKQHMEKSHGWKYDRSRHSSRRNEDGGNASVADVTGMQQMVAPVQPQLPAHGVSTDFVLYPENTDPALLALDFTSNVNNANCLAGTTQLAAGTYLATTQPQQPLVVDPNTIVPWDSPPTHREEISDIIRSTEHSIGAQTTPPSVAAAVQQQLLQQPMYPKYISGFYTAPADYTSSAVTFAGTPQVFSYPTAPYASPFTPLMEKTIPPPMPQPFAQQSMEGAVVAATIYGVAANSAQTAPAAQPASSVAQYARHGIKRDRDEESEGGDDDDDDSRDPKRMRPSGPVVIDEDRMPCPYHLTDPEYFNRIREERFSPCHTEHRYISTLLRHTKRAAHNLVITETSVSSFGVFEPNRPQPHAGLCRRCWTAFHDPEAFQAHISHQPPCSKVSRSKREKYDLIQRTFCSRPGVLAQVPLPPSEPQSPPPAPAVGGGMSPAVAADGAEQLPADAAAPATPAPVAPVTPAVPATLPPIAPVTVAPVHQALPGPSIKVAAPTQTQGDAMDRKRGHHKQQASLESLDFNDAQSYATRKSLRAVEQHLGDRVDKVEQDMHSLALQMQRVRRHLALVSASGNGAIHQAALSSMAQPAVAAAAMAAPVADGSAYDSGSLVRSMDRQTALAEDDEDDERDEGHSSIAGPLSASQILVGVGNAMRTMSGLSSGSSASSSVRHIPAVASEETGRLVPPSPHPQQEAQHLDRQQQAQSANQAPDQPLAMADETVTPINTADDTLVESADTNNRFEMAAAVAAAAAAAVLRQEAMSEQATAADMDAFADVDVEMAVTAGFETGGPGLKLPQAAGAATDADVNVHVDSYAEIDDGVQAPSMFEEDIMLNFGDHGAVSW